MAALLERVRPTAGPSALIIAVIGLSIGCQPVAVSGSRPGGQGGKTGTSVDRERDAGPGAADPGPQVDGPSLPPSADASAGIDGGPTTAAPSACPGGKAAAPASCAALGVVVAPDYAPFYSCFDLGPVPGLPMHKYGGLTLTRATCSDTLLIGGDANLAGGKVYAIKVGRDPAGHISGFEGTATPFADAPYNDGGVAYGPGGVLFITRYPSNELQQTRPGSTAADKTTALMSVGVPHSSGSLGFVPANLPGGNAFKLVSWPGGQWHTLGLSPDAMDTFDVAAGKSTLTLPGGPEGFVYVAAGSPLFTAHSLLVSEWSANKIATYEIDASGDPTLTTRKDFITGLQGAEGAYRDPATGDFFFSTWGQQLDRVIVVRGFAPITID
jgi:hypothetical protein